MQELLLLLLSRFSHVRLLVTPQTAAHQAPLSTGFSRQAYWSGLPFPSPLRSSLVAESGGYSLVEVPGGILTAVAYLAAEHRLSSCGAGT